MLILTRKIGEVVHILLKDGSEIQIKIIKPEHKKANSKQVKLGITADKDIKIWRGEIMEKIAQENLEVHHD